MENFVSILLYENVIDKGYAEVFNKIKIFFFFPLITLSGKKKKKKKKKEKKAQEVIFSRTISKLFYSQICFNDVYICKNLSE